LPRPPIEPSRDGPQESVFFRENEALKLRKGEIGTARFIYVKLCPINFISRQAVTRNPDPGDIVGALMRYEISQQVNAIAMG
jgi:hypothetical protein